MMTKIPSRKVAGIKILSGIVIALALVVIFACEKKNSTRMASGTSGDLAIECTDSLLKISGTPEEINKVDSILRSGNYHIVTMKVPEQNTSYILFKKSKETAGGNSRAWEISKASTGGEEVFFMVEEMPEYPGGEVALRKYITSAVDYPALAQEKGIQGKVYVTFVVSSEGSVKNAKIARGVDPLLDQEALRVVNSMPRWQPGKQSGKNVNVSYTVPISFVLQ